ncbi:MAG: Fic family protein [Planctomycetota bacterium]
MRLLTAEEVLAIHQVLAATSGGASGLRDRGLLESAVAQAMMSFNGEDLYPDLIDKAAAVGHALIANHPFLDGNKRIGHACIEATLMLSGHTLTAEVDDAEAMIMSVAAGSADRVALTQWVRHHASPTNP